MEYLPLDVILVTALFLLVLGLSIKEFIKYVSKLNEDIQDDRNQNQQRVAQNVELQVERGQNEIKVEIVQEAKQNENEHKNNEHDNLDINDKQEETICSICNQEFKSKISLTCKHLFCAECIIGNKNDKNVAINCPTCDIKITKIFQKFTSSEDNKELCSKIESINKENEKIVLPQNQNAVDQNQENIEWNIGGVAITIKRIIILMFIIWILYEFFSPIIGGIGLLFEFLEAISPLLELLG